MLRGRSLLRSNNILGATSVVWLASFIYSSVCAAPYSQQLTQYRHSAWRLQDGFFSSPNSIAQTKDGYLWIGTDSGLVRFDGVRFVPWNTFPGGSIATWPIDRVLAARDGTLWISGAHIVAQVTDRQISRYEVEGRAVDLAEDASGAIWLVRTRTFDGNGPLCKVTQGKVRCYGRPEIDLPYAAVLSTSREGGFWLGSPGGLCRWSPEQTAICYLQGALKSSSQLISVNALLTTRDGELWVGITSPGKELGLGKLVDGIWQSVKVAGLDGSSLSVTSLMEDREGSIWVGTTAQGLYRIRAGQAEHFGLSEGLSGGHVGDIYEDREGIVWVSTSGGLDSFRRLPVSIFSAREGLPADTVDAVLPSRDGSIWIGSSQLSRLVNDVPEAPPKAALFRGRRATSLLEDQAGRLWVGLNGTLNIFEHGTLTPVQTRNGGQLGPVEFIAEDSSGDVWAISAAVPPRVYRIRNASAVEKLDPEQFGEPYALASDPTEGMWFGYANGAIALYRHGELKSFPADSVSQVPIRALLPQADGTIFAATPSGLLIQNYPSRRLLNVQHGLPCDPMRTLLRDSQDALWLSASCGLIRIEGAELRRWLTDPDSKIQFRLFDRTDGVLPGIGSFSPNAQRDRDGRLWFTTSKVAQMIDPTTLNEHPPPLLVRIEQMIVDQKVYAADAVMALESKTRDIEIQYTAPSFSVPQKILFKYQLEGRDRTWTEAGTRRAAFYNDLPPGRYRFKVIARNSDGNWNTDGATLHFDILPAFYQTKSFAIFCLFAALILIYLIYLLRLRQVAARIRDRVAAKNAERERIARELHDTLLQSTQGLVLRFQAAANRIPRDDPARAELEKALSRADEVIAEGRDRVQNLRTLDKDSSNLERSLTEVAEELARDYELECRIAVEGRSQDLDPIIRDEAYGIGREALLNAFRHAHATLVEVQIIYTESDFRLRVRDDGRGIDGPALEGAGRPGHWGMRGMRERAVKIGAELEIWSRTGTGAEVELKVPAKLAYVQRTRCFGWLTAAWGTARD